MEFYNEFLKNRIENKKFTHSYLFESKDSKIANEDALKFAKYLISGGERGLFSGNTIFTDLKIVFPVKNNIGIDEVREVISFFSTYPEREKKVVIIRDAQFLRKESANALLKTLEEPPFYGVIILVTDNIQKIIPTVVSRCSIVNYNTVEREDENFPKNELYKILMKLNKNQLSYIFSSGKFFEDYKEISFEVFRYILKFYKDVYDFQRGLYGKNSDKNDYTEIFKKHKYITDKNVANISNKIANVSFNLKNNVNYQLSVEETLLYIWEEINDKNSRDKV